MSAKILAEFDSFYQAPQKHESSSTPASNDLFSLSGTGNHAHAGDGATFSQWQAPAAKPNNDIWGGKTGFSSATVIQQHKTSPDDIWNSFEGNNGQTEVPGQDVLQPDYGGFTKDYIPPKPPTKTAPPPHPALVSRSSYGEILFDADEMAEDDDEFGDFETGTTEPDPQPPLSHSLSGMFGATNLDPKTTKRPAELDSTTTSFSGGKLPYPQAPISPFFHKQVNEAKKEVKSNSASPVTAWPTFEPQITKPAPYIDSPAADEADEEWGDFADLPRESPAVQTTKAASGIEVDAWAWDAIDHVSEPTPAPVATRVDAPPPTNIPPPSVILALFAVLFDLPQSTLFKAVANQPFSLKNRIISDPSTVDFLRGYLLIATVAARIIAARKLRWKRDNILSQAMKIGPAAAGGKGGMKLTGVDKAEITREDREAADVVRVWKEQLGRLRSAIAVANSSMHDTSAHLAIPDISDNMYVKTEQNGLGAPKPCIVCGLKREERINKVDIQVEDSFGEWWVDHWGHRACRNFWLEHEPKIKDR